MTPVGRRIAKKVNGVLTGKYLWSSLTTLLAVYDGADSLKMRFEYADGRMPFAVVKDGVRYYLAYDQVRSLRVIADASGNVVKKIEYDTFGSVLTDSAPLFEVPFGFAGGFYDRDVELVRFGYRDYDPEIGRWTAKDPILFAGGDVDLFGYCANDPVNMVDPEGLILQALAIPLIAKAAEIVAGAAIGAMTGTLLGGYLSDKLFNESSEDSEDSDSCSVEDLDPLHSPETIGERPDIEGLSDDELLDSVNNPSNDDPLTVNTETGKLHDGNTRAQELIKRSKDPNSSITPKIKVRVTPYTPDKSMFWDL